MRTSLLLLAVLLIFIKRFIYILLRSDGKQSELRNFMFWYSLL